MEPHEKIQAHARESGCGYVALFENEHGELAVYGFAGETSEATLWLGDADWLPCAVSDEGTVATFKDGKGGLAILTASEALWLRACWRATHR